MASRVTLLLLYCAAVMMMVGVPTTVANAAAEEQQGLDSSSSRTMKLVQPFDSGVCTSTAAETLRDACANFLVGKTPPTPFPTSPCCKAARNNRPLLPCLCSTSLPSSSGSTPNTVNPLGVLRFNTFCLVSLECVPK